VVAEASANAGLGRLDSADSGALPETGAGRGEFDYRTGRTKATAADRMAVVAEIDDYLNRRYPGLLNADIVLSNLAIEKALVTSEGAATRSYVPRSNVLLRLSVQGNDGVVDLHQVYGGFGDFEDRFDRIDWMFEAVDRLYEELREINPELIMISMPGFGLTGTWSHYTAFANTTEQMSGLPHLTGYSDDQPIFSGTTGGDPLAGVMGALALLSAVERRSRLNARGEAGGCHIDLSQTETATSFTGEAVTAYSISGEDHGRQGNYHPRIAPHNTYPCRDDEWIAIACETDAQFAALARLMDRDDWLEMASDFVHRDAAREAMDAAIGTARSRRRWPRPLAWRR